MTADLNPSAEAKARRVERLCQALALVAALWAVVAVVTWCPRPSPLRIAEQAIADGQLPLAVECYLQHLAQHPRDWRSRFELAAVLDGIDPLQSLVELRKIPSDADQYQEALRFMARVCLDRGRDREAKETLLTLESLTPDDAWVHLSLAQVFSRQRELAIALDHARQAAKLDPSRAAAHFLVAELLDELDRRAEMIPPLLAVLDLQPEDYAAHSNLSYAYAKTGRPAEARREALWCLARNPKDFQAHRWLAMAAREDGKLDEAKAEIDKALQLAPEDLNCRVLEAELLLFARQADKAFQRLQPLYERYPNELRLTALLAQAAAASGRPKDAENYRQQLQRLRQRKP